MDEIAGVNSGIDIQSFLRIILAQLTYQDPLNPTDNTEFVSQLAQFSQLQQTQLLNEQVTNLLAAQSATQATTLLGRTVDALVGSSTISGTVQAVSFASGAPQLTVLTATGQTISNVSIANVTQVR